MIPLNDEFLARMSALLGEEFEDFCASLTKPMQKAVYVNSNKMDKDIFKEIIDFEVNPISYETNGFYVDVEKLGKHLLHLAGAFYSQEPSAMFTVNAIDFAGDEYVLDMCAAPGGKTIQLANRVPNGVVVANEINFARSKILYSNVERMGLKNVIVTNDDPKRVSEAYSNTFDVCLVDAPCSAEGMFRRDEKYIKGWNENLPKMCKARQLEILEEANRCLKQGGKLIYSTCTYSLEENEEVVTEFLKRHNYKLLDIKTDNTLPRGVGMKECVRMYPHKVRGEGQFVAALEKLETNNLMPEPCLKLKVDKDFQVFLSDNLNIKFEGYKFYEDTYFIFDAKLIKNNIKYISVGVKLGRDDKNGFMPDHFMFSAFGRDFKRTLNLDYKEDNTKKYFHGDVIETNLPDGFGAIIVNGCPVGGFKISKGQFKNHFPKGLRV